MSIVMPNPAAPTNDGAEVEPCLPLVAVEDVEMRFGRLQAVRGVSFEVRSGEVLALVGESGSGKSTVGRCIVRLLNPSSGTVRIGGVDVTRMSRRRLRDVRRDVQMVFQDPGSSLDPRMTVASIVREPLDLHRVGSKAERTARAHELLERVGLTGRFANRYPHQLSGGQRQRVSIARALAVQPKLLIADEPTSALDVSVQASILNLLRELQRDFGFGCLFITHDLGAVEYLADRVAVMYLGRIVEIGDRDQVFGAPRHPYTRALLSAAPVPDPVEQRSRRRTILTGDLPSPLHPPTGCAFHPRCPEVIARCSSDVPELRRTDTAGSAACHLSVPDVAR